ncbi:MAG: hypothetical protein JW729_05275, partial [Bacteroidales bacterium]|nr:hypothetical protein [Bacteroidales bacterium]
MKKLFYLFLMVGLVIVSCNKQAVTPTEFEISFSADIAQTGFKASVCDNAVADYAVIKITGLDDQTIDVFYLDGKIYTNTIKISLPAGTTTFTVTDFAIFDENDVQLYATPYVTADYAQFVTHGLPATFTVAPFTKTEVNLDVLCFEGATITNFGFAWFTFNTVTVRELCFFGDFCTDDYLDYEGTLYATQSGGLR